MNNKTLKSGSMQSFDGKLYSYNTVIAQKIDGKTYFNRTRYSVTTSKQQTYTAYEIGKHTLIKKHVPIGCYDLTEYI